MKIFFCELSILKRLFIDFHQEKLKASFDTHNGVIKCNSNSMWTVYQFPVEMLLLLMVTNSLQYKGTSKKDSRSWSLWFSSRLSSLSHNLPPTSQEWAASSSGPSQPSVRGAELWTNKWCTGKWPMNWQTVWLSVSVISVGQYSVYLYDFGIRNQLRPCKQHTQKRVCNSHVNALTINKT